MIQVFRSDTGQYVLTHPPSETVVIDEDRDAGYKKIAACIEEECPEFVERAEEPFADKAAAPRARARWALVILVAALAFAWLAGFRYSYGAVVSDSQAGSESGARVSGGGAGQSGVE